MQPLWLHSCIFAPIKSTKINQEVLGAFEDRIDTVWDTDRADQRTDPYVTPERAQISPARPASWEHSRLADSGRELSRLRALPVSCPGYVSVRACRWKLKKLQRVWSKTHLIQTQRTPTGFRTDLDSPCPNMNNIKILALPLLIALLHCECFPPGFKYVFKKYAGVIGDRKISSGKHRRHSRPIAKSFQGKKCIIF